MTYYYENRQRAHTEARMSGSSILLFDEDCRLCRGFVDFILAHEKEETVRFCAVQSRAGREFLMYFGLPVADWESNVLIENERACFKSEAFFRVAARLRWPWRLVRLARVVPAGLLDWLYDRIARVRYVFGSCRRCHAATGCTAPRFIRSLASIPNDR